VGLNPGCSATNRKWDVEKFARVGQLLLEKHPDVHLVVCGGPQDRADAARIGEVVENSRCHDATGKLSLSGTAALIERCAAFVTNDTGPMHMSVAVGTPVVGVFGPIEAKQRLPLQAEHIGLEHNERCQKSGVRQCGRGKPCPCLDSISPEEVFEAVTQILARAELGDTREI
jgi:ADP-heptose:LPS heptosyltransferase